MLFKMVVNSLGFAGAHGLLLFLPAGTLAWPQAWVFMALFVGCSQATGVWLTKTDPELLAARSRSPISADQKPRDRAVMVAILIVLLGWVVFMALDARRFGWSHTSPPAQALGAALIVSAFWSWIGVLRANTFAAITVRLQAERGQTVVSTGPYAVVRHPMYAYTLLLMVGTPLLLGSLWGLAWLMLFLPLLALRTLGEEGILRHHRLRTEKAEHLSRPAIRPAHPTMLRHYCVGLIEPCHWRFDTDFSRILLGLLRSFWHGSVQG